LPPSLRPGIGANGMAKPAAIPERESDIQATIRDWLRWHGWYVVRHHQTLGSHKGLADLQAIKGGRVIMIEVKTARGRLSQDQVQFAADWEDHGGTYILARSVEDVERSLKLMEVV